MGRADEILKKAGLMFDKFIVRVELVGEDQEQTANYSKLHEDLKKRVFHDPSSLEERHVICRMPPIFYSRGALPQRLGTWPTKRRNNHGKRISWSSLLGMKTKTPSHY